MSICELFAAVFTYPGADYGEHVRELTQSAPAECAPLLAHFAESVGAMTTAQVQEMYTSAFDLNPSCALDLGWHLFGEKYERGLLLVRMRQELRHYGIAESSELPDHLTHALLLLDRMDREHAADFAGAIVLPALHKILAAMKEGNNPYQDVLRALDLFIRAAHSDFEFGQPAAELPVLQEVDG